MFTAETDGVQDMDIRDHTKVSGSTANGALPAEDEFLEPAPSASPSTGPEVAASAPDNGGDAGQVGQKRTLRCGEAEGERPKKKVRVEAPAPSPGAQKSTFKAKEIPPPNNESQTASTSTSTTAVTPLPPRPTPPPLLTHLTCGINEVYKALERQIQGMREAVDGLVEVQPGKKRIKYGQGKGKGKEKDGAGEGKEGVDGDGDGVFSLRELMQEEGEGSSTGKKGKQGKGKGKKVSIAADAMDVDENTEGAGGDTAPHPAKQVDTKKQPEAPAIKPTIPLADIPTLLPDPLRIIFACKDDVNPPDLIAPLPTYCSTWNSLIRQSRSRIQNAIREVHALSNASAQEVGDALKGKTNEQGEEEVKRRKVWMEVAVEVMKRTVEVWVVTLPQGGEMKLAEVMGLRRVAVLALNSSFPGIDAFLRQIKSADLKPLLPPYPIHAQNPLTPHALPTSTSTFAPTQLKAIQTTTPKDPRAKKAKRMEEVKAKRVEKKEGRKKERERREKEGVVVGGMVVGGEEGREKMEGEKRDEKMWRNRIRGMKLEERRKKETVDFVPIA